MTGDSTGFWYFFLALIGCAVIIVVGFLVVNQNTAESNQKALMQDISQITGLAQVWRRKAAILDGGGGSFQSLNFGKIGFNPTNANGNYSISVLAGNKRVKIEAIGKAKNGDYFVRVVAIIDQNGPPTWDYLEFE